MVCSKCKVDKPVDSFFRKSCVAIGRKSSCKECCRAGERKILRTCLMCSVDFLVPAFRRGKFCSAACAGRHRLGSQSGALNLNWKGGVTSEINRFYHSVEWKSIRREAFERDNFTCRDCFRRGGRLEANHIKPRSRFPDLKLVLNNIETLCKKCHDAKKWIVYVGS